MSAKIGRRRVAMEDQMEKKMKKKMETGIMWGFRVCQLGKKIAER